MSIKAMNWYWENSTERGAGLLAILAIADNANDDGEAYPGIPRLAKKIRMTERYTQILLRKLEEKGELKIDTGKGVETGHGATNRYHLLKYQASLDGVNHSSPQEVNPDSPKPSVEPSKKNKDSVPAENAGTPPQTKPRASQPSKGNPWYDAINVIWRYTGAMNGAMQKMLQGKATAPSWKEGNVRVYMTPDDTLTWAAWYRATELHGDEKLNMLEERMKIASSIEYWHSLGKPTAAISLLDGLRIAS